MNLNYKIVKESLLEGIKPASVANKILDEDFNINIHELYKNIKYIQTLDKTKLPNELLKIDDVNTLNEIYPEIVDDMFNFTRILYKLFNQSYEFDKIKNLLSDDMSILKQNIIKVTNLTDIVNEGIILDIYNYLKSINNEIEEISLSHLYDDLNAVNILREISNEQEEELEKILDKYTQKYIINVNDYYIQIKNKKRKTYEF